MELPKELIDEYVGNAHVNIAREKELLEQYSEMLNVPAHWGETASLRAGGGIE